MVLLISNNRTMLYAYCLKSTLDYKPQPYLSSEKTNTVITVISQCLLKTVSYSRYDMIICIISRYDMGVAKEDLST